MPSCGSQCYLCDLPVRFDTYFGCSHACKYCFASKFTDIRNVKKLESVNALKSWIEGKRTKDTNWCDWNIPLHWGGLSDPFQPCEKIHRISYECLQVLKETQYPFVVSTKGELIADDEYLDLMAECNGVLQISAVCSKYDVIEKGCPTFERRMEILKKASGKCKRVIIRIQPYMHEVYQDVYDNLKIMADNGAYGVVIEGMKFRKAKKGLVRIGGDQCYPYDLIKEDFLKLQQRGHELGLKVYAGENRIRSLGDSLTCCGIDGLEGFRSNTFNLNHILNGDKPEASEKMKEAYTGNAFRALAQGTVKGNIIDAQSFAYNMLNMYKENKKNLDLVMGLRKE